MNTLRLEIINLNAPYRVKQREDKPQHYTMTNIIFKLQRERWKVR